MTIKQDHIALALLALLLAAFAWLAWVSTGTEGGEDSFMHYLFARYVPEHPENLLDHWGKPLHTLLLTPFAQYGFNAAKLYNCLAGVLTAWFTYKAADRLGLKTSLAAIVFLLFAPLYFMALNSALTEITFSLVIAAGVYFLVSGNYFVSAIVLSFLPFARTEGFILLPFFGLFFLWQKKYIPFFFLGLGLIIYSAAGYFYHYHDIFWVFTKNPYAGRGGIYGHGTNFWHFADGYRDIWGGPQTIMLVIGLLSFFFSLNRASRVGIENTSENFRHWLLIVCCAVDYFMAHSIVWYYGLQGSAGLLRVMAGVAPLFALISTRGLEAIYKRVLLAPNFRLAVVCTILFFVVEYPINRHTLPVHLGPEEKTLYSAGEWYKQSPYYKKSRVFYFAPTVGIAFDIDPFDFEQRGFLHDAKDTSLVPPGSLVVYDMHFGPNECQFPLDSIVNNPAYKTVHREIPTRPFTVLGGYNYEVYIFERK